MQAVLPFLTLHQSHPGITAAIGACYAEAASVCLDRHYSSPAQFVIDGPSKKQEAVAEWKATSSNIANAWANDTDATEFGAYGLALAAVEIGEGLVAVRRAETHTGADYYIGPPDAPTDDLESWLRLEVSGVDHGDEAAVRARVRMKVRQALQGASNLPALAAVVGFKAKLVAIAKAE